MLHGAWMVELLVIPVTSHPGNTLPVAGVTFVVNLLPEWSADGIYCHAPFPLSLSIWGWWNRIREVTRAPRRLLGVWIMAAHSVSVMTDSGLLDTLHLEQKWRIPRSLHPKLAAHLLNTCKTYFFALFFLGWPSPLPKSVPLFFSPPHSFYLRLHHSFRLCLSVCLRFSLSLFLWGYLVFFSPGGSSNERAALIAICATNLDLCVCARTVCQTDCLLIRPRPPG